VAHAYVWDSLADLGNTNNLHVRIRFTPADASAGSPAATGEFAVINGGRNNTFTDYDNRPGQLVLRTAIRNGSIGPAARDWVDTVRIYGDGKVVFAPGSNPTGNREIRQGWLSEAEIVALLLFVKEKGFWGFQSSYRPSGPAIAGAPTEIIEVRLQGRTHTSQAYAPALSAPSEFREVFAQTSHPALRARNVVSYVRQPIDPGELAQGYYGGEEYQKKLGTPDNWFWENGSQGPRWRAP
jgi:hypothetical protein